MNKYTVIFIFLTSLSLSLAAQDFNSIDESGNMRMAGKRNKGGADSLNTHKEIPKGLKVWTVDEYFGDRTMAEPDTMSHLYMNTIFTSGLYGEYNTTGNLGAARQNRIFTDRYEGDDFIFVHPYDYMNTDVGNFHFTNTYSPITNVSLNSCGNRTNGEDHFKALFAVNAGKAIGVGMKFDYIYGRGYYQNNSAALFNYTLYGSYIGDRYQAHLLFTTVHHKQAENGGITDDNFITHPESFSDNYNISELPTMLTENWNRNDFQHIFYTHRYSLGFNRKVPMTEEEIKAKKFAIESQKENNADKAKEEARKQAEKEGRTFDEEEYDEQLAYDRAHGIARPEDAALAEADTTWLKNEYVPVTSFIHTVKFDNYSHIYQAYYTPQDYYAHTYNTLSRFAGDSIYDKTTHYCLRNTFAVALLEGFNKYAKAGLKAFVSHDMKHFTLPDTLHMSSTHNENSIFAGGQISKQEGETLHYQATGEFGVAGADFGEMYLDAEADLNFRLFGDTVQLAAKGGFYLTNPSYYQDSYHSRHFWWDNQFDKSTHTHLEGLFTLRRTKTTLRVAADDLTKYIYLTNSYDVGENYQRLNNTAMFKQHDKNLSVFTAQLMQDFKLGPLNLETRLTYQKSSDDKVIPLPELNVYANLFMRFKIAHVLDCDMGADVRYFTKYDVPDFVPGLAQYAVQENTASKVKLGNYPFVNVYANFFLKHTRFFVMMSHINCSGDGGNYFLTPHYPTNQRVFRFGVSWNFFN